MDLIHAATMLRGFQNTVNDHFPACRTLPFHLIVSQRVSLHLLCSLRPSPSPPPLSCFMRRFRSAVKYASLFSSVNWDPVFGQQRRIAFLPKISILKNKKNKNNRKNQLGLNKPPQGDWASRQQSIKKRKWAGINLAANLPFTAEQILIHDRDGKRKWLTVKDWQGVTLAGASIWICVNSDGGGGEQKPTDPVKRDKFNLTSWWP